MAKVIWFRVSLNKEFKHFKRDTAGHGEETINTAATVFH